VDIDKNRTLLGWSPPINVDKAMQQTARDFMEKHSK
jgi:nucleoside-diphosphate-sugar epimerase